MYKGCILVWLLCIVALMPFSLYSFIGQNIEVETSDKKGSSFPGEMKQEKRYLADTSPVLGVNQKHYDHVFEYSYVDTRSNTSYSGNPLYASQYILEKHHLPLKYLKHLNLSNIQDFVFVTGCSSDQYRVSRDAIATIQNKYPEYTVLFYDLGLTSRQVADLRSLCNVTYRPFNLSDYPATQSQSKLAVQQSAKIFCIMDALINHSGAFWFDPSVRFQDPSVISQLVSGGVIQNGGIAFMSTSSHSSFAVTHPTTYKYLPTDIEAQKHILQAATHAFLVYKTKPIVQGILWWWFLCSLNPDCISPTMIYECQFKGKDIWETYAGCNRFDQSVANILVSNLFRNNVTMYSYPVKYHGGFVMKRGGTGEYEPRQCHITQP